MSHSFLEYRPFTGEISTRLTGTLVSMEQGKAMPYALDTSRLVAATSSFVGRKIEREVY